MTSAIPAAMNATSRTLPEVAQVAGLVPRQIPPVTKMAATLPTSKVEGVGGIFSIFG